MIESFVLLWFLWLGVHHYPHNGTRHFYFHWAIILVGLLLSTTTHPSYSVVVSAWSLLDSNKAIPSLTPPPSLLLPSSSRRVAMQQLGKGLLVVATTSATTILHPSIVQAAAVSTTTTDLKEEYRQGTAALADMDDAAPVPREAYRKLDSGVIYADVLPGKGPATVQVGSRVNLQWVLRRSNGYFVDSSQVQDSVPFIFTVGDEAAAIAGVNQGVVGMKEGGVRRLLIPPSLAYVQGLEDGKPGPLPAGYGPRQQMRRVQLVRKDVPGEYIFLEVQATRVR